jgi:hypothetical protein
VERLFGKAERAVQAELEARIRPIAEQAYRWVPTALNALVEIINDKTHPDRLGAIRELLDRVYGKPVQATRHEGAPLSELHITVSTGVPRGNGGADVIDHPAGTFGPKVLDAGESSD